MTRLTALPEVSWCCRFSRIVDRMAAQAAEKRSRILKHMQSKRVRQNFQAPEVRRLRRPASCHVCAWRLGRLHAAASVCAFAACLGRAPL